MSEQKNDKPILHQVSRRCTPSSAQRNQNLNSAMRLNATTSCKGRLNMAVPTPTVDWGLQCDLAYNTYLQSLMTVKILKQAVRTHTIHINDQLSLQADLLSKAIARKSEVEEEIEEHELTPRLIHLSRVLQTVLELAKNNFSPEVESKIDCLTGILNGACRSLYLKKVKPLHSQQDYDKLEQTLQCCVKQLQKAVVVSGNVESTQKLANCLNTYKQLSSDILKIEKSVVELQDKVACSTLSTLSDKLANHRGYN